MRVKKLGPLQGAKKKRMRPDGYYPKFEFPQLNRTLRKGVLDASETVNVEERKGPMKKKTIDEESETFRSSFEDDEFPSPSRASSKNEKRRKLTERSELKIDLEKFFTKN